MQEPRDEASVDETRDRPLLGVVVVELTGSVAGAYCAKMFANGGADVVVIGEPTLSEDQRTYFDVDKRRADADQIDWASVDVIIESSAPEPLTPTQVPGDHLIRVQISPFGRTGERAGWLSSDLTDYALSGHSYLYGDPEREPLAGPPDQPAIAAGLYGFIGAMAALLARPRLGHGQTVDVSHVQVMVALHQVTLLRWLMTGNVFCRMGNRYTGQGQPNGPYRCRDGWVSIVGVTVPQVEAILAVTGLTHLLDHPDIGSPLDFQSHPEVLDVPLGAWLATQAVDDVVDLFQAMRIPTAPLRTPLELLDDPQLAARDFFRTPAEDPTIRIPGQPFSFSHHQQRGSGAWAPGDLGAGPLAGLKVLDLARVWAGPMSARILRDLGADVVWVEAPWHRGPKQIPQSLLDATRLYPNDDAGERQWNRNTHFVKYALGKRSLAIDLQTEAGQRTLRRLVPQFHVLLENFSTRVMPQLGLDEDRLHQLNPDLIYLTMPGYGRSGPAENWLAYGSSVDSHGGLSSLIGYADETPWKGGIAWPDPIAGLHATSAVLMRLWAVIEGRSGGVTIEAAQFESTVAVIGDRMVEAQRGRPFMPPGYRRSGWIAQGVYRCAGHDNWIAISIADRGALDVVGSVLGISVRRVENGTEFDHDVLDDDIGSATIGLDAAALAQQLQKEGVPAAKIAKAPDVMDDPHLRSRGAWVSFDQPDVGPFTAPVTPIGLSATPARPPSAAPTLGQHNHEVLAEAGLSPDEIAALESESILVTEPPG